MGDATVSLPKMEIVNRRDYGEDFPFMLFFVMWLNMSSILFVLMPVEQA